ncbi:MAG: carbohydrate ABC transporter permease [Christensenellales bacterium]
MVENNMEIVKSKKPKRSHGETVFNCFLYAILTLLVIVMLYPFLYMIAVSLSDRLEVSNVILLPRKITFQAYEQIFSWTLTLSGYKNSIMYTVLGTVVSIVLTTFAAYPISKNWLVGRKFITFFLLITMYFSGGLIPQYIVIKQIYGLYDNLWVMILPGALNTYYVMIMLTFYKGIPKDIEEAAYIDGAGELRTMFSIYLPLSVPIFSTLILFYAVGIWNSWFGAFIYLSSPEKYPLQLVLRNLMESFSVDLGQIGSSGQIDPVSFNYALTVAAVLPILVCFPFVQKFFERGVVIGSLKG